MRQLLERAGAAAALTTIAAMACAVGTPVIEFSVESLADPSGGVAAWTVDSGNLVRSGYGPIGPYQIVHYDDSFQGTHAFAKQDLSPLATADVDYTYVVRNGNFTGDDRFHQQTTLITLTANPNESVRISFRVHYPTTEWYPDISSQPFVDDVSSMSVHVYDLNGNGALLQGLLWIPQPGGMFLSSINNRYDSPVESQFMGVPVGSLVAGTGSDVLVSGGGYSLGTRTPAGPSSGAPYLPISVYTDAGFTLSAGDSVSFGLYRTLPAPGTLGMLTVAGLSIGRRHRQR